MNKTQAKELVEGVLKPCIGLDMTDYGNKVLFNGLFNKCLRDLAREGFRVHPDITPNWTLTGCEILPDGGILFNYSH